MYSYLFFLGGVNRNFIIYIYSVVSAVFIPTHKLSILQASSKFFHGAFPYDLKLLIPKCSMYGFGNLYELNFIHILCICVSNEVA